MLDSANPRLSERGSKTHMSCFCEHERSALWSLGLEGESHHTNAAYSERYGQPRYTYLHKLVLTYVQLEHILKG